MPINQTEWKGGERKMRGRAGPVALHSSPFTPFIIHPKQILFSLVSEDFGRGVCFNNEASFRLKHPFY